MKDDTTQALADRISRPPSESLQLVMADGDRLSVHALPKSGTIVIGRSVDAHVKLTTRAVSRDHARIHVGERIEVEDLDSTNGTFVQNRRIAPWTRIAILPGDGILLGDVLIMVLPTEVASSVGNAPTAQPSANRSEKRLRAPVVEDPAMKALYKLAERVASVPSPISVLILGETGTGKELLAETIHQASARAACKFVALNCAALSETLLESELFGYERGAFTGALQTKPGLLEDAAGGTVFLDELGEMVPALQAKLLRVLETREVLRVGGRKARPIDVRFVAATNRDLEQEVAAGRFRSDLYYRLNVVTLHVPALRERTTEIVSLANRFISERCAAFGWSRTPELSPAAAETLERHSWPGNVRELRNTVERALVQLEPNALQIEAEILQLGNGSLAQAPITIPPTLPPPAEASTDADADALRPRISTPPRSFRGEVGDLERDLILETLARCAGNQTRAAKELGISRNTLIARLAMYGVSRPRK
ncbi:MAG: sigma 54-interacting transcriptional regulator [Polyangiaceae bacterium]